MAENVQVYVRTLTGAYGGLFTHWVKGRSVYCDPGRCDGPWHKLPRYWKGYTAAEVYDLSVERWSPIVLEITETLELDFRQGFERGQVWEISRGEVIKQSKPAVRGKLLESIDPSALREPFDISPVLRRLYHVETLSLSAKNPLPDRVMVEHSDGAPPPGVATRAKRVQETPDISVDEWRDMIAKTGQRWKPRENGNGTAG